MTTTLRLPPVFEYQRDALFGPERYAVVEGCTKVGKTFPGMIWLLEEAGQNPGTGHKFWWIAPTHGQAEIAYTRTRDLLRKADPTGRWFNARDHRKDIEIAGVGVLEYKTGEEPDNLYGDDVYAAIMDEFTRQREAAFIAVRSTLTATGGKLRMIGNVNGRLNWGYRLARRAEAGAPNMRYRKLTCEHAVAVGLMPQSEVDDARAMLPEAVFRELYYAEPSEDGANPFGHGHIAACYGPIEAPGKPAAFGVDLARSVDWTVVVGLDANAQVVRFDRWQHVPWDETQRRILSIVGNTPTLADSTGVGDAVVESMRRTRSSIEPYTFTSKSKQQLMEGLAVGVQQRRIRFAEDVIRRELDTFEYETTRTGVRYTAPDGLHDDCVMALGLAYRKLDQLANTAAPSVAWVTTASPPKMQAATARTIDDIDRWFDEQQEVFA